MNTCFCWGGMVVGGWGVKFNLSGQNNSRNFNGSADLLGPLNTHPVLSVSAH